ncbi:hypothetical protein [Streptomyces sp. NPDC007369]|uniref:hypothetical protein n=1 Tax=Streptomyces sp. NPDC007369 TaxID=3154589 RepID=UPI0033C613EC
MSGAFAAGLPQTQPAAQASSQNTPNGNWNWCDDWRGGRWSDWRDWRDWRYCCDRWDRNWCWDHHGRGGDGRFDDHRRWNDHHRGGNGHDHHRGGYAGWDWYYWR